MKPYIKTYCTSCTRALYNRHIPSYPIEQDVDVPISFHFAGYLLRAMRQDYPDNAKC